MKNLFRSVMIAKGDTYETLAEKLGITPGTLCKKINGKIKFSLADVKTIMELYGLSAEEAANLFLRD